MRLRSLLASAAVVATMGIGSIAMMAGPASAAPLNGNVQCFEQQCNQPPKCPGGIMNGNGGRQQDSKGCCAETITFDFAPNVGASDGTWLLETSGPALHNGETVTYNGGTWTVQQWVTPPDLRAKGSLGKGDYFILVKGGVTLSGSLSENPRTAWISGEQCIPQPRPCDRNWNQQNDPNWASDSHRCGFNPDPCITDGWNQWKNSEGTWGDSHCTDPRPVGCVTGEHNTYTDSPITDSNNSKCDPQPCNTEGIRPETDILPNGGNGCLPCFPVTTRVTIPWCAPKGHDGKGSDNGGGGFGKFIH